MGCSGRVRGHPALTLHLVFATRSFGFARYTWRIVDFISRVVLRNWETYIYIYIYIYIIHMYAYVYVYIYAHTYKTYISSNMNIE